MSKLALFLILLALATVTYAFDRPWEDRTWVAANPSIWSYGIEIWWDLIELDQSLQSLELEELRTIDTNDATSAHIDEAITHQREASSNRLVCVSSSILRPLWFGMQFTVPSADLLAEFVRLYSCMQYRYDWIDTIDHSLLAVESSVEEARKEILDARSAYDEVLFMGLCNSSYTNTGNEYCAEMQSAFHTVDNGLTEGKYGKYSLLSTYSEDLNYELQQSTPELSAVGSIIGLAWGEGGVIQSFRTLRYKAGETKNLSIDTFNHLKDSAAGRKSIVNSELNELKRQEVHLIDGAPSSYVVRKPGTVSELYSGILDREDKASIVFEEAKLERYRTYKHGYLANAIAWMAAADAEYGAIVAEVEELENYAEEIVSQQRIEAYRELQNSELFTQSTTASTEAINLYNLAQSYFESAESANTLGSKYHYYYQAAAKARATQIRRTYGEELDIKSMLAELDLLIQRAEKDEINIAGERESLVLLENLQENQIDDAIQASISSIIMKARLKYDDKLLDMHARIHDKLALAGDSAADLSTDLGNMEDDLISGRQINYPDAIGHLKELEQNYLSLEQELDQYMSTIVGNSMSVTGDPIVDGVWLDEPSNVILDVVMTNDRDYAADNPAAKISLPNPIPFLFSDITYGKEAVESMYSTSGGKILVLVFKHVLPFETKRVIFEKDYLIAQTTRKKTESAGIGDGSVRLKEDIGFQLDIDILGLDLPEGFDGAMVDGGDSDRALKAGKHTLSVERIIAGAYSESIENIKCYGVGTNSRVEYDIRITSDLDIDSVPIFIDSINDSRIKSLNIFAATGESITDKKRISETQYAAKVKNVRKDGLTVIKVSYEVEDTESFVQEQIDHAAYSGTSDEVREMIEQARLQANAGNFSRALELLEKSRALSKDEEKQTSKLQKEYDELSQKLADELNEISGSLLATNLSSPLTDKLTARKNELERLFGEISNSTLENKVLLLDEMDDNWLEKELKSYMKDSYKEYNDLKERFYLAGNSSTPEEFLDFESALNRLETGHRLEYAMQTQKALNAVESLVESQEKIQQSEQQSMNADLIKVTEELDSALAHYSREAASAKGTEYSSLFTESERSIEQAVEEAKSSLEKNPYVFDVKLADLNKRLRRLQTTLDLLENETKAKVSLVETVAGETDIDPDKKDDILAKIRVMRNMLAAGQYVNALRTGDEIAAELDKSYKEDDNGILILGITALAILTVLGAYIWKYQMAGDPKKQLRKLERAKDPKSTTSSGAVGGGTANRNKSSAP